MTDTPPVAARKPHVHREHGVDRPDPYHWLRDREDPEVIAYVEAENAFTQARTAHLAELRTALFDEMLGRIQEDDSSVPARKGESWTYTRTETGKSYPIHCRKSGSLDAPEEVLLDVNELGAAHEYVSVPTVAVSHDGRLLMYAIDTVGRETYELRFKDLATGEQLPDVIVGMSGDAEWASDGKTLLYTTLDDSLRPDRVRRHVLGESEDDLLYTETDDRFRVALGGSRSEKWLFIHSDSSLSSEIRVLDATEPGGEPRLLIPRRPKVEIADIAHSGDHFFAVTNDHALNFRLVRLAIDGSGAVEEVVAHRPDVHLLSVSAFHDHLILSEREAGVRQLRWLPLDGSAPFLIEMSESSYVAYVGQNPEYRSNTLRFSYSSLVTPSSVIEVTPSTGSRAVLKETVVLGGFDKADYVSERVFATARDGTQVPISIVHRADLDRTRPAPLLLYGYGAYGMPTDPSFASTRLSFLDRGMVYAIAHVRGSGDLGRPWYEAGKFEHKPNTFSDFIDCATHLQAEGWTTPTQTAIYGGSAGGLLMGAVLNQAPELCHVAIAAVPFVDVVTTMLDATIPLTTNEWEEWGDPREKRFFDVMLSYSPYDNVTEQAYPHLLITSGLHDPRVQYWEPTKWTARLRVRKTDDHDVLLKTEMGAGHGGKSGRHGRLEDAAFNYAFMLDKLGLASL